MVYQSALTSQSWNQVGKKKSTGFWFDHKTFTYDRKFWFAGNSPITTDKIPFQGKHPTEGKEWLGSHLFAIALSESIIIGSARLDGLVRMDRSLSLVAVNWEEYTTNGLKTIYREGDRALAVFIDPSMAELRKLNVDFLFTTAIVLGG